MAGGCRVSSLSVFGVAVVGRGAAGFHGPLVGAACWSGRDGLMLVRIVGASRVGAGERSGSARPRVRGGPVGGGLAGHGGRCVRQRRTGAAAGVWALPPSGFVVGQGEHLVRAVNSTASATIATQIRYGRSRAGAGWSVRWPCRCGCGPRYHYVTTAKLATDAGATWSRYASGDHTQPPSQRTRDS